MVTLFAEKMAGGTDNHIIIISSSCHLLCKKGDHLSEVDGSWSLTDEVISLCICDWSSNIHKGSFEVVGSDDAILVDINDTKCFLEFLDLLLTEQGEDVRSGLLGLLGSFSGHCFSLLFSSLESESTKKSV